MVKFKSKNKVKPEFNMASMTDMIFLLLIFFMLTSNLVTPTALPINLPSTKKDQTVIEIQKVNISITKDARYYVNDNEVQASELESILSREFKGEGYEKGDTQVPVAILYIDKEVAVEHLVKVAGIVNSLGAKISLATKQEE